MRVLFLLFRGKVMKRQNRIKISLFIGIIAIVMLTGGCQSQENEDTAVVTRSPTRSDLIKEGKIEVKEKTDTDEGTTEERVSEATPLPETVQQPEGSDVNNTDPQQQNIDHYILNTNTRLFHDPSCEKVSYIAPHNYAEFDGIRDELIGQGYSACYTCDP
jgi:hypothetical protein